MPYDNSIPTNPGPFSFLASAGRAAGAVGEAITARKLQRDEEARRRLSDILALVNSGVDPTPDIEMAARSAMEHLRLAGPQTEQTLQPNAGMGDPNAPGPWFSQPSVLGGPAERARLALQLSRTQVRREESAATVDAAKAGVSGRVAAAEAASAEAAARTAGAQATGAESDLGIRQRINELITTELRQPESTFGRLASRAAAGILPYYTTMLQVKYGQDALARERQRELFTLFFEPLNNASAVWQQRLKSWEQRRQLELLGHEDDQEYVKNWETNNPQPALQAVQQELLEGAAGARGMTVEQYNQRLNQAIGLMSEAEGDALPPAKLQALQTRVGEVMSGAKTADQVIEEIKLFYRSRGTPSANFEALTDVANFQRMLQEAQGGNRRR